MKEIKAGYQTGLIVLAIVFSFVWGRHITIEDATKDLKAICEKGRAFQIEGGDDIYTCYNVSKLENQE
jgi:hypothetical protein